MNLPLALSAFSAALCNPPQQGSLHIQRDDYWGNRSILGLIGTGEIFGEAKKQNSSYITIPFNRQQLADYLSVDRSAMSNELCKMRDDGLLEFDKNQFKLL